MVDVVIDTVGSFGPGAPSGVLDSENVAKRWQEIDESLARLMSWMDSKETWMRHDGDNSLLEILHHIIDLSESEDAVKEMHKPFLAGQLAHVLSWVQTSRFFRLLEVMDRNSPNFVNRFVLALGRVGGEASVYADLFFERVMLIHRGELLGRVFGENRTTAIAEAIRTIREQHQ